MKAFLLLAAVALPLASCTTEVVPAPAPRVTAVTTTQQTTTLAGPTTTTVETTRRY